MLGKKNPAITRRPVSVPKKVKVAVIGAALVFAAAFGGKNYFDERGRIDTVAEFDVAIGGLEAGELNHGLRDLLNDAIDQFAADATVPAEDREIRGVLDREGYVKAREAIVDRWLAQAEAGKFVGEGEEAILERAAVEELTGWKPGVDPAQARTAFRALVDAMVVTAANSPRALVYSDLESAGLPALGKSALVNLNEARKAIDPAAKALTPGDFGSDSRILETSMGAPAAPGLGF